MMIPVLLMAWLYVGLAQHSPMTTRSGGTGRRVGRARDNDTASSVVDVDLHALQRVAELLAALQALDQQQLRRLEAIEYKLTKLEVQHQDKTESMRTDLRDVSTRVQQVDWAVSKMEAGLETIKVDITNVHESVRARRVHVPTNEPEAPGKLHMLSTSLHGMRSTLSVLVRDMAAVRSNVSRLANISDTITHVSNHQLGRQPFTAAILDLKQSQQVTCPGRVQEVLPSDLGLPRDCAEVHEKGENRSGVYRLRPPGGTKPFYAHCELDTLGGGWTVVQHRYEGTVDFYRGWLDYKHGFGNLAGEFWLGLDKLHHLTQYTVNELLVELQDFNEQKVTARYDAFVIGSEMEGYPIAVLGAYEGDAGDSLLYHAGHKFSTSDSDNDGWPDGSCAESHAGSWWYNGCDNSNLNGRYLSGELPEHYQYKGMYWYDWHGPSYSLQSSRMLIRPRKETRGVKTAVKKTTRRVTTERTPRVTTEDDEDSQ